IRDLIVTGVQTCALPILAGTLAGLFDEAAPRVRVEVRGKTKPLSTPVTASYGFDEATGDVQLRPTEGQDREIEPNTVTLMLSDKIGRASCRERVDSKVGA